ncbi:MAG: hypothetical protein FD143_459 [Ignavibacteria bacterium]|nr:MAG: hypothetical protein FD143_459 [Ignavibacteria bacterium]KAF0161530.1 MAG: hypothetical protein FD188_647 [Ignavibacteria bacterium]
MLNIGENMKKQFLLILFLAISSVSFAQTIGGSFMLGYPQGEFRSNVDRMGFGGQIQGTLWTPSKERPFTIGFDIGYIVYGQVDEKLPWIGYPGVYLDLSRTNSMGSAHILMQISPFFGTIRPYVECLFGGAYLQTRTTVRNENKNEEIASSTNFDDVTWNYGGGAGMLFRLGGASENVEAIYLDLKARYLFGTEAEYLTEKSLLYVKANGEPVFAVKKSKTDFFSFHIGAVVNLDLL